VAKEKIEELDMGSMVRPVAHGRSGSADSRGDDVPDHYYQCALSLTLHAQPGSAAT